MEVCIYARIDNIKQAQSVEIVSNRREIYPLLGSGQPMLADTIREVKHGRTSCALKGRSRDYCGVIGIWVCGSHLLCMSVRWGLERRSEK